MHGRLEPIAALALAAALAAQQPVQQPAHLPAKAQQDPLIVHEWGTFTSMQGADGASLEGLQWEEEALPKFVHSHHAFGLQRIHHEVGKKLDRVRKVTQKMETPVIYFYSETRRSVRVRVDFVGGLMTQWYPVANAMTPWPEQLKSRTANGPLDMSKVERSMLDWKVELIPLHLGLPDEIPAVAKDDPWQFAREVGAASVRTIAPLPKVAGPQAERYLFYRGLGTFRLPVQVEAARGARAVFRNGDAHPIPFAVAMEVGPAGGRMRELGAVGAGARAEYGLDDLAYLPMDTFVSRVHRLVVKTLHAQGLRTDEATAMVRTWSRQWFRTPGNRVIYVLPRPRVDALLPMQVTPKPDQLVRVLVGRLEYLTPEVEDRVEDALRRTLSPDAAVRTAGRHDLRAHGRFLEPKLRRIVARTDDPALREAGQLVLSGLK